MPSEFLVLEDDIVSHKNAQTKGFSAWDYTLNCFVQFWNYRQGFKQAKHIGTVMTIECREIDLHVFCHGKSRNTRES